MADDEKQVILKPGETVVSEATLKQVLDKQTEIEMELEAQKAKNAGLEAMFSQNASEPMGEKKLRERKDFNPAFRTVTMKKFPIGGDPENEGIVVGYTNRGAYQKVDKSGVSAQLVDWIDVVFLDHERTEDGKISAESVPLLSLMGAPEVTCKVLEVKDYEGKPLKFRYSPLDEMTSERPGEQRVPTGEALRVTTWDPKHGLVETGEEIDGWVAFTNTTFVLQIPGHTEPVEVDSKFCNI